MARGFRYGWTMNRDSKTNNAADALVADATCSLRAPVQPADVISPAVFRPVFDLLKGLVQGLERVEAAGEMAPVPVDGKLVPVEVAAKMLGCGRTRVFELLKSGALRKGRSQGRRTMVTRTSVERLAAAARPASVLEAPLGGPRLRGRRRGGA